MDGQGNEDVDLIVVGSGAGALLAAVKAADEGLSTLLIEKTAWIGGTSAISGGGIWIPDNHDLPYAGLSDSIEAAYRYVKACARGLASNDRILAYVETARVLARYLDSVGVHYRCMPRYSDYYPGMDGALPGGRTMDPVPFDAAQLGVEALEHVRPTNPGQLVFGRVHVTAFEAHEMLSRVRGSTLKLMWLLLRYALDYPWRKSTRRDRRLTGGQALIAGLYAAARSRGVVVWRGTALRSLIVDGGRVSGVVAQRDGQDLRLHARKAVLLGAGGFERNQAMREQYLPKPTDATWTATPANANTGDAILAGARVGGALHLMSHTWGAPTLQVPKEEKARALFVERSLPGCMVVNARGERFLNESGPYPEFQQAMFANHAAGGGAVPAWIVFDADFRAQSPMGPLMPGKAVPDHKLRKSWLGKVYWKGETLAELAAQIGVDAQGLERSAARMTEYAAAGQDPDFLRGDNSFDRYYGDPRRKNPNLGPIAKGPFYAMQLWPGDIGTKGGLLTDRDGRVLDDQGRPISGLYCVGNNSASVMGPAYPGAGSTLGPAMTFAYRAVMHLAGRPMALLNPGLLAQ